MKKNEIIVTISLVFSMFLSIIMIGAINVAQNDFEVGFVGLKNYLDETPC